MTESPNTNLGDQHAQLDLEINPAVIPTIYSGTGG